MGKYDIRVDAGRGRVKVVIDKCDALFLAWSEKLFLVALVPLVVLPSRRALTVMSAYLFLGFGLRLSLVIIFIGKFGCGSLECDGTESDRLDFRVGNEREDVSFELF